MKILLVGEFSGVHNNLKKGLSSLGHFVKIASDCDSYRGFSTDYKIAPYHGLVGKLRNVLSFFFHIRHFVGYDVIQFINPFLLPKYFRFFAIDSILFKYNKMKVYYACGTDFAYLKSKEKMRYFPFDDINSPNCPHFTNVHKKIYDTFIEKMDCIVPAMYDYYLGYATSKKVCPPIPLPGSGKQCETCFVNTPVTVLFGITRSDVKGADFILKALKDIKTHYPDIVVDIVERLPFKDYLLHIQKADILIDQCKSYSYGMNAIFALERGVIVLSGAEPEALDYLNVKDCPIVNITPSSDDIFLAIQSLLSSNEILELKEKSLAYADHYHNPESVAKQFIVVYKNEK